jgi:4'-phosphopantetheinyl transferase EntD
MATVNRFGQVEKSQGESCAHVRACLGPAKAGVWVLAASQQDCAKQGVKLDHDFGKSRSEFSSAHARYALTAVTRPQHRINCAHAMHFAPCWPAGFVFWVPAIDIKVGPNGFVVFGINKL